MKIEDRMSMWAAKRPREEPAELLLEGAQEIADLRRHRDEDAQQMSALIAECQLQKDLLVNGGTLTDEEREAVEWFARHSNHGMSMRRSAMLRSLLERLS
jgi:hypothetical protein